jgi:hypothetical protein
LSCHRGREWRDVFKLFAPFHILADFFIEFNIGDKESSSDLETGAEPHRIELEEEFGKMPS